MRSSLGLRLLVATLIPLASADVEFTSPAAGASIPAGQFTVEWSESGDAPKISSLESYTLQLLVGGNDENNALPLVTIADAGKFAAGNKATGTIDPALAGSTKNGFYLKMISVAKEGGTVTNYSKRFTMAGMKGNTPSVYEKAASGLGTTGPSTDNAIVANAGGAAPADGLNVPYGEQGGPIRYAPMQPQPPTKITKKGTAMPLHPKSDYKLALTKMPPPVAQTTQTATATYQYMTMENTVPAQQGPQDDMAKFLARWKD